MSKLLFIVTVLLITGGTAIAQEAKKIALIVAVSEYKKGTDWDNLSSDKDVPLIKEALKQQGFKEENIVVLKDKPTKKAIFAAIQKSLIEKAKPGDVAVFHFSGHGQQITDDNGDETDGYDEAIVPYDAPKIAPLDYDISTEKHIRDDELGFKLDTLREKLGANGSLLVLVDACHSGTSTRGLSNFRGTSQKFEINKTAFKKTAGKKINTALFNLGESKPGYAAMACYFGSSADECNEEATVNGEKCGSLSLAFSRSLAVADKKTSYRALFDAIKQQMSVLVHNQTPQAEGDLDVEMFGGKALGKPNYFTVINVVEEKKVTINCGKIMGIFSGTTVKLYPPDTRLADTATVKPLANGEISAASQYSSQVQLDKKLTDEQMKTAWVYLNEVNYGDLKVRVKIAIADVDLKKQAETLLKENKQAELVSINADLIIEQGVQGFNADSLNISNSGELFINRANLRTNGQFNLQRMLDTTISNYARANYLRNLPLKNEELNVILEFVPVNYTPPSGNNEAIIQDLKLTTKMQAENIVFEAGDRFRLNIINQSGKRVYYTVLDIQPNNQVNVLYPAKNQNADECFIKPDIDTLKLMRVFKISPPYGTDVIKVITSEQPIDLRPIFTSRGATTRGDVTKSPLQKLMQGTFNTEGVRTRGGDEETIPPSEVNIFTTEFKIVPKKQ